MGGTVRSFKDKPVKSTATRRLVLGAVLVTAVFLIGHCWTHSNGGHESPAVRISGFFTSITSLTSLATSSMYCSNYDPVPAFLPQAQAGFKKHVEDRLRRMGGSLPSIEDLGAGGSVQHLPTRAQMEARMLVPTFSCASQQRLGKWGAGGTGKWVCTAYFKNSKSGVDGSAPSLEVVSVGGGDNDTTFERDVFDFLKTKPVVFDPLHVPVELEQLKSAKFMVYHEGVGVVGATMVKGTRQHLSSVTWLSVTGLLKFLQKKDGEMVDILNLDCNGCEDAIIAELHSPEFSREKQPFGQILIRLNNVNDVKQTMRLLLRLEAIGYRMFHNERDAYNTNFQDVSFIHESLVTPSPAEPALKFLTGSPFLCSNPKSLLKLLSAAECAYSRNVQRRYSVTGPLKLPSTDQVASEPFLYQGMQRFEFESIMLTPTYSCVQERRLGVWGEGGKWACLGFCQPERVKMPMVVSIGCNGDGSFEAGVFYVLNTVPHTFDPFIPAVEAAMENVRHMRFHPMGLTGESKLPEVSKKHPHVHWLTVSGMFGYLGVEYIDVFKIDCEGCEFAVVEELHAKYDRKSAPFGQILMEIHDTRNVTSMTRLVLSLEDLGYRMFHSEVNAYHPLCWEIGLIHESLVKPEMLGQK